jgi:energy-coupling factor transport system permease protein
VNAGRLHAITWALWALSAALTVQLAPNPVYVVVVIGIAFLAVETHHLEGPTARAFPVLVGIAVVFAALRVVLTALTTHGVGQVLFTLPEATLPKVLGGFTVGGTIEAPVVALAAAEGLAVIGVIAAFAAFNAVASHAELLQVAPRAFHEPGLVVTVALAFVPATLGAIEAARDADLARTGGVVVRRGRLTRLVIPVVETGLEKAVALAESMDARGFARGGATRLDRLAGWLGLAGLLALAGSFVALIGRANPTAIGLSAAGTTLLVGAVVAASAGPRPTRYRPRRLARLDVLVMAVVLVCPVGVSVLAVQGDDSLRWATSPLAFPSVSPVLLVLLAFLAAPCAVGRQAHAPESEAVAATHERTSVSVR